MLICHCCFIGWANQVSRHTTRQVSYFSQQQEKREEEVGQKNRYRNELTSKVFTENSRAAFVSEGPFCIWKKNEKV